MAPHDGNAAILQGRDNADAVSYHLATIFFSLFALCLVIMAPMFYMMWLLHSDLRNDAKASDRVRRARIWKCATVAQHQQQSRYGAQQPPGMANAEAQAQAKEPIANSLTYRVRMTTIFSKLGAMAISSQQAVISKIQMIWHKLKQPFNGRKPSRNRSRTSMSMDLPIMRQPAWQDLASGSMIGIATPSTTFNDVSKPMSTEIDVVDQYNVTDVRSYRQLGLKPMQLEGFEVQKARPVVGLALG